MTQTTPSVEQYAAWQFYGLPSSVVSPTMTSPSSRPVGELGYTVGWISDQLSRLDWRVLIGGSATWRVRTPDGRTIRSNEDQSDQSQPDHPVTASRTLLRLISWSDETVKQLGVNLFVAGECEFAAGTKNSEWTVISVIKPHRKELIERSAFHVRALWPHPADPDCPDAPVFAALPILGQLDWLTRLGEAQSSNRVGMRGVVGLADDMATQNGKAFWDELNDAMQQNMSDPDNAAPVVLKGPAELVKPSGSGMEGFSWVIPEFPYDDKVDEKITRCIQRLAYSLPIPPEILLGLQAQSRATAFQVEDSAYRAHIEPPARMIGRVAARALQLLLDQQLDVEVEVDPTALLARRHTVQDVLEAYDRGAVSLAYLRSVLGIPEHAAPTQEDLDILFALNRVTRSDEQAADDPANSAAQDPAPSQMSASRMSDTARTLHTELGPRAPEIARQLYLQGVTQQVTDRCRERVGAKARTHEDLRADLAPEVPNQQVAAALGVERLRSSGIDVTGVVQSTVLASMPNVTPDDADRLVEHVLSTLESADSLPLP